MRGDGRPVKAMIEEALRMRRERAAGPRISTPVAGLPLYGAEEEDEGEGDDSDPDPEPDTEPTTSTDSGELKRIRSELDRARKEAAANRTAKRELERIKAEQMTEAEKVQAAKEAAEKEAAEARTELLTMRLENSISKAALKLGFADPDDAFALVDKSALDIDETTGAPSSESVKAELDRLAKAKPYLLGRNTTPSTGSGDGEGRGDAPPPPNDTDQNAKIEKYKKELLEQGAVAWPS